MTLNCLTLSKWVLSLIWQAITKLLKLYFLCTYDDQMKILKRFSFKFSFTKLSLVFFPLFSKPFTKIYNKIPKTQPNTCLNNDNLPDQCSAKSILFFVASDVVPNAYNKPWRLSFNEIIKT